MIKAMESGTGSISTTHASDAVAAVRKLVTCAMEAGPHITQALATGKLAATVDLIVHLGLRTKTDAGGETTRQRVVAPRSSRSTRARGRPATRRLTCSRQTPEGVAMPDVLPDAYRGLASHGFDLSGYLLPAGALDMIVLLPALAGALIVGGLICARSRSHSL